MFPVVETTGYDDLESLKKTALLQGSSIHIIEKHYKHSQRFQPLELSHIIENNFKHSQRFQPLKRKECQTLLYAPVVETTGYVFLKDLI